MVNTNSGKFDFTSYSVSKFQEETEFMEAKQRKKKYTVLRLVGWLVVGFMIDCLTRDLGQWVGCPPWGSF